MVSGASDNMLRVWDLKIGRELVSFSVDGTVTRCMAAHDSRTIIAGDAFGRLHFLRIVEADVTKPAIGDTKMPLVHQE